MTRKIGVRRQDLIPDLEFDVSFRLDLVFVAGVFGPQLQLRARVSFTKNYGNISCPLKDDGDYC